MTMNNAIEAFTAATTGEEVRAAYAAMLGWSDAPEGAAEDDVDAMLDRMGLPSLSQRLHQAEMADTDAGIDIVADGKAVAANAEYAAWLDAGGNG